MDITLLIQSVLGLLVLLVLLVAFMNLTPKSSVKKKPQKKTTSSHTKVNTDLVHLKSIIKRRKSTTKELKTALDLIIKHHGTIHKKLGQRAHPDFDIYMDILFTICRHPNTTKHLILDFDKELERLNPEYKPEINNAIAKGLNSRGV